MIKSITWDPAAKVITDKQKWLKRLYDYSNHMLVDNKHKFEIESACILHGQIIFIVNWKSDNQNDQMVMASVANEHCPQEVIAYYEKIHRFTI